MSDFGVTAAGYKPMALTQIKAALEASLQAAFGQNINLAPEGVFGQFVGIMAEREALLWQLGQGLYNANNPAAASGLAVDNILALNNLQRLPARATVTAPQPAQAAGEVTLYGLVLYGDPGTTIPAGALVSDGKALPATFSIDAAATIGPPSNARQALTLSNRPTSGSFQLEIFNAAGDGFLTPHFGYGALAADLQSPIRALAADDGSLPFTDVAVSDTTNGYVFDYGAAEPAKNQPATASAAIPLLAVAESTLAAASEATNLTALESRVGAPAQAVASATCTDTGPIEVAAGALTTIVTPQNGWTGVTNQLDCLVGADLETDAAAIARFRALRSSQGSSSLAALVQRVLQVDGVSSVAGYQNLTNAALQSLRFVGMPTQGTYRLATDTGTTAPLPYSATAADLQAALAALPGFAPVRVTGSAEYGFTVDFNGSEGGQAQNLLTVLNNGTGAVLLPGFGRPPHSVELVVRGGADEEIGRALLEALPAGVAAYGAPVATTTGSIARRSTQLAVADASGALAGLTVSMTGLPLGTKIASISGQMLTLTAAALATVSNAPCEMNHMPRLADSAGNTQSVGFSRPVPTLVYVQVSLLTDRYLAPGDPTSGENAASRFRPASVATIQENLLTIGNSVPVGGLVVTQGSGGLVGSFNAIPGIVSYSLAVGTAPGPTSTANLAMQATQAPVFQKANIAVSYR